MRALSLWQPHASLIAIGVKRFETRTWQPPKAFVGQRIAIHAAKRRDDLYGLQVTWSDDDNAVATALQPHILSPWDLPLGCVVCTAILAEAVSTDHHDFSGEAFGNFESGRWAWRLTDVQHLPEPVPWRGAQGFFVVPDEVIHGLK